MSPTPARPIPVTLGEAKNAVAVFVARACNAGDAREAADWSLAAKNMASAIHSLAGASITESRAA